MPQIFWPGDGSQFEAEDCSATLGGMREELVLAGGACVAETSDITAFRSVLTSFDDRYHALSRACGETPGYRDLLTFRYALAMHVERYVAEVRPLSERAEASISH